MDWIGCSHGVIYPPLDHFAWLISAFLIGSCIGSFLNVVIYRLPLGLSVNNPKRSFCPSCKGEIPMSRNIPVFSWLALRGKCADCKAPISPRYLGVELLTGLLFVAAHWVIVGFLENPRQPEPLLLALPLVWYFIAACVALSFIDAEHMIIPLELTVSATVCGLLAAAAMPVLPDIVGWNSLDPNWLDGLKQSALGWVIGFFGLWAVVLAGKMAFGRAKWEHEEPVAWLLEEPTEDDKPILFHMGKEQVEWWDLFNRKSDRLIIEAESVIVNGREQPGGTVIITEEGVTLPDESKVSLEDLKSLEGMAKSAVVPREAMGMGDVHLMGVIGAFFGFMGVFFTLFASSMYAIVWALFSRIGFGRPLPYGPFIVLGGLTWLFGGWKLAEWYLASLR